MSILRAMAALGTVFALVAAATIAAPNDDVRRERRRGATTGQHQRSVEGVVIKVHRNAKLGNSGTITIRLGSPHHYRTAANAARARRQQQHQFRTLTFQVQNDTQFLHTVRSGKNRKQASVSFQTIQKGHHIVAYRKGNEGLVASLVNILEDGQQRRSAARAHYYRRTSPRRTVATTAVVVRKVPLRHSLMTTTVTRKHVSATVAGAPVVRSKSARSSVKKTLKADRFFEGQNHPAGQGTPTSPASRKTASKTAKARSETTGSSTSMKPASKPKPSATHSGQKPPAPKQGSKGSSSHKSSGGRKK
jgi:hypothetical protein